MYIYIYIYIEDLIIWLVVWIAFDLRLDLSLGLFPASPDTFHNSDRAPRTRQSLRHPKVGSGVTFGPKWLKLGSLNLQKQQFRCREASKSHKHKFR